MTRLYQLWLVLLGTLLLNMIACIFILVAGSRDGGRDVGASIGYVSVQPPNYVLLILSQVTYLPSPPSPSCCGTGAS